MSLDTSLREIYLFGSYAIILFHEMIFLDLSVSIYGTKTLVEGTSRKDDTRFFAIGSFIAFVSILAASARDIGLLGRKSPSS